jgi:acyl-CoA synthetase (AMP-forming)/AMP-acid ligase II
VNQPRFVEATISGRFRALTIQHPDREAMRFLTGAGKAAETATYGQLWVHSACFAEALREHVAPGGRVLLLLPQTLDYMRAYLGCQLAGAVAVTLFPPRSRSIGRFAAIIEDCDAQVALIERDALDLVEEMVANHAALARVRWLVVEDIALEDRRDCAVHAAARDDVAFLQYTSGSTSTPKGVMVTHDNILRHTELFARMTGMSADSVLVSWLPLFHDFGMIGMALQALMLGARSVIMSPFTFTKRPLYWLEAISEYRGTHSGGPNFGFQACCEAAAGELPEGTDLSSWSCAINGAEPVRLATLRTFAERFARHGFRPEALSPGYGLAEATLAVSVKRPNPGEGLAIHIDGAAAARRQVVRVAGDGEDASEMVSCGISGTELEIVDEQTCEVAQPGRIGEIWLRGPIVAAGYWNKPDDTARTFGAEIAGRPGVRYLRTGDLGFLHDGELYIAGRIKDIMIVRGENIYPQDVERTVETSHPALRPGGGAAFVAADGDDALVVVQEVRRGADSSLDPASVCARIRAEIADGHGVDVAEVVLIRQGSIPKTSSGKIQRGATRAAYLERTLQVVARHSFRSDERPAAVTGGAA